MSSQDTQIDFPATLLSRSPCDRRCGSWVAVGCAARVPLLLLSKRASSGAQESKCINFFLVETTSSERLWYRSSLGSWFYWQAKVQHVVLIFECDWMLTLMVGAGRLFLVCVPMTPSGIVTNISTIFRNFLKWGQRVMWITHKWSLNTADRFLNSKK